VTFPVEEHGRRLDRAFSRAVLERASDDRLVALTREGYDAAFEAIVRRYRTPLVRYGTAFLDFARAEDAVQQALLKALTALRRDDRPMQLKPWLYRIVHNEALNAVRRQELATAELDEEFDGVPQPPDVVARSERLREVVSGINHLPRRQRSAVVLRELEGRSYDEIATELGTTTPVVRALLHRARTRLRDTCGALLPIHAIRAWLEAMTSSATSAGAVKVGTAAVVTGVIAGGAAAGLPSGLPSGMPSKHIHHQGPVAGARGAPALPAGPSAGRPLQAKPRPSSLKTADVHPATTPRAPALARPSKALPQPVIGERLPDRYGVHKRGEDSGGADKHPKKGDGTDQSGPPSGDAPEKVSLAGEEHRGPGSSDHGETPPPPAGGDGSGDGADDGTAP
jgi:RNA polymerase sigma factor (sigma-70 family)